MNLNTPKTTFFRNTVHNICNSKPVKATAALTILIGTAWAIDKGYYETQSLKIGLSIGVALLCATAHDLCNPSERKKENILFPTAAIAGISSAVFLTNLGLNILTAAPPHCDYGDKWSSDNFVMKQISEGENDAIKTNTLTWHTGNGWERQTKTFTSTAKVTSSIPSDIKGTEQIIVQTKDVFGKTMSKPFLRDKKGLFTNKSREVMVFSPRQRKQTWEIKESWSRSLASHIIGQESPDNVNKALMGYIANGRDEKKVSGIIYEEGIAKTINCRAEVTRRTPTNLQGIENIIVQKTGDCGNEQLSFIRDNNATADSRRFHGLYIKQTYDDYKNFNWKTPFFYKPVKIIAHVAFKFIGLATPHRN